MNGTLAMMNRPHTIAACRPASKQASPSRLRVSAYTTSAGRGGVSGAAMQNIAEFPSHIDRNVFGAWLSGFVAGEGTFVLSMRRSTPRASFAIVLRSDDAEILHTIQSYWQCGRIYTIRRKKNAHLHKQEVKIEVYSTADMLTILVPHFDRFPLFAKKRRDFEIWKQGVAFIHSVSKRKRHRSGGHGQWGRSKKWLTTEKEHFLGLHDELRRVRKIDSASTDKIIPKPLKDELFLFQDQ